MTDPICVIILEDHPEAKSTFLANMSHEIRTPMKTVMGLTHLTLQTDLNLTKIQYSARHLLGLLNDILDFSKIEAGKLELGSVPFDMRELLKELEAILRGMVEGKDLDIHYCQQVMAKGGGYE